VIVGDSITDGRGSITDMNNRLVPPAFPSSILIEPSWPDLLLAKMQSHIKTSNIAVLNQAAGGNRILHDGLGPNTLSRIDRDVLSQSGIGYAMIFEGVNDIGTGAIDASSQKVIGDRLIAALTQIALRVHAKDIPCFAATITPFSAPNYNTTLQSYSDPERERTRQRVNAWIRNSGTFDEVIDFDRILRNETHPEQLSGLYNGGDWLHPNVAGYQAIADNFPLGIF
jgi:lysophospholipase L1-like esterase